MTNLDHILDHISADAPCSLFHVASWAEHQLNMPSRLEFFKVIDTLASSGLIALEVTDSGLVVDLI